MSVLAVIPARMGSARIPRKNLLEIEPGLTLVQQAIDCATGCGLVDEVVVSTDEPTMPVRGAGIVLRPPELCGPASDIADAVHHAWLNTPSCVRHDLIVTLQPAVLARSPLILRHCIERAHDTNHPVVTMAHTVIWHWQQRGDETRIDWLKNGRYPRSQDAPTCWAEVNAITVAHAYDVSRRMRWTFPLVIASLPSWAIALDIDTPSDLATARGLWPWAKRELETWQPAFHLIHRIAEGLVA